MSKGRKPKLKWGDGYVQKKILSSGRERYYARWREPDVLRGSRYRSVGFDIEEDAYAYLAKKGEDRRAGRYEPEPQITLSQAVSEYCESRLANDKWKTNTYQTNKVFQHRMIDPLLGKTRVTRLKPGMIQEWVDSLDDAGKSASTIGSVLSIVRGALRRMVQMEIISTNPSEAVESKRRKQQTKEVWSVEQVREILHSVSEDPFLHAFMPSPSIPACAQARSAHSAGAISIGQPMSSMSSAPSRKTQLRRKS